MASPAGGLAAQAASGPPTPVGGPQLQQRPGMHGNPLILDDEDEDLMVSAPDLEIKSLEPDDFGNDSGDELNEDLEEAIRRIQQRTLVSSTDKPEREGKSLGASPELTKDTRLQPDQQPMFKENPEVVDDFIRNYLVTKCMYATLEAFQNEWYELLQMGKLPPEDAADVPDVYQKNSLLETSLRAVRGELDTCKELCEKMKGMYDKARKERDFFKMHHNRTLQEKSKLQTDVKRLTRTLDELDSAARAANARAEIAMKERAMAKLDRDKLAMRLQTMEQWRGSPDVSKLPELPTKDVQRSTSASPPAAHPEGKPSFKPDPERGGPFGIPPPAAGRKKTKPRAPDLPAQDRSNPYSSVAASTQPVRLHGLRELVTIKGHEMAISALAFHPRKLVLVTVSDDHTWKLWNFPSGELLMNGEGHMDWIADVDFHPKGTQLATASGDMTVKLWDFSKARAIATLRDHTQPVWGCKFHDTGNYLVSCSMDHTAKLWDLNTGKCRQTFRGHSDSVNDVAWQPYTNTFYTASGDKTLSAWDARNGQCVHTLFGHTNAINGVSFAPAGDRFATCDADGIVKLWETRASSELMSADFGPHPVNKVALDMSGIVIAAASNEGVCKLYNSRDRSRRELAGHRDAVQFCAFDHIQGEHLATCSSDGTWKAWS